MSFSPRTSSPARCDHTHTPAGLHAQGSTSQDDKCWMASLICRTRTTAKGQNNDFQGGGGGGRNGGAGAGSRCCTINELWEQMRSTVTLGDGALNAQSRPERGDIPSALLPLKNVLEGGEGCVD